MSGGLRKLAKNEYLFREGDVSDAMYVIKSGRIAITKSKGSGEIVLAEKNGGEMLGEMAFFDNKPRSAGAKAIQDTEVIALAFTALHAQFKTFPEWLKAMVRTVNAQLREANSRIKNMEAIVTNEEEMFPPHTITRLTAILSLIGFKSGEQTAGGLALPYGQLRDYCIQIFQQPTNKLDKLMETLQGLGHMKVEELGEGKKRVVLLRHQLLADFTDYFNKYIFTEEAKRVTIGERDLNPMRALLFYGRRAGAPDAQGFVTVDLTQMQAKASADLGFAFNFIDADPLVEKGLAEEKRSEQGSTLSMKVKLAEIETLLPFWEIIYALKKVPLRK